MFPDLYKSLLSSLRPLMAMDSSEMTFFKSVMTGRAAGGGNLSGKEDLL